MMRMRSSKKARDAQDATFTIRKDHHELLGAATLSGAVVGATTGLMAGPPGIIAGGIIGSAVGALAGTALERDQRYSSEHDDDLDEEIGVRGGEIGAREPALNGMNALERMEREEARERESREIALDHSLDPDSDSRTSDEFDEEEIPDTIRQH